jgi:hypothetical protein
MAGRRRSAPVRSPGAAAVRPSVSCARLLLALLVLLGCCSTGIALAASAGGGGSGGGGGGPFERASEGGGGGGGGGGGWPRPHIIYHSAGAAPWQRGDPSPLFPAAADAGALSVQSFAVGEGKGGVGVVEQTSAGLDGVARFIARWEEGMRGAVELCCGAGAYTRSLLSST